MYYKVDEITKLELVEIDDDIPVEYKAVSDKELLIIAMDYILDTGRYEAFLNYADLVVDTNEIHYKKRNYKKRRIENGK